MIGFWQSMVATYLILFAFDSPSIANCPTLGPIDLQTLLQGLQSAALLRSRQRDMGIYSRIKAVGPY